MSNFFIEKRQVTIVKLLKTRWANKLKNLLNQESVLFNTTIPDTCVCAYLDQLL